MDKRLQQKVTYSTANTRLHDVTSELTRITGVNVCCGKDIADWRVRDLPLTIHVEQIRLGKLIRALTVAGDLIAETEKTRSGIAYRLLTPPSNAKAALINTRIKKKYLDDLLMWRWDVLLRSRRIPNREIRNRYLYSADSWSEQLNLLRSCAGLIAILDLKTRSQIASGNIITLTPKSAPVAVQKPLLNFLSALFNYYNGVQRSYVSPRSAYKEQSISKTELQVSTLILRRFEGDNIYLGAAFRRNTDGVEFGISLSDVVYWLENGVEPKKLPYLAWPRYLSTRLASADERGFSKYGRSDYVTDPKSIFNTDFAVTIQDGKRATSFAEALLALSKSTGYSIVCEDLETREGDTYQSWPSTNSVQLKGLHGFHKGYDWWVDENEKLLVGRQGGDINKGFAPARVVERLINKANSIGIDLDDLAPILSYPCIPSWYPELHDLAHWSITDSRRRPLWEFYFALSSADRARAESEQGLPLAKFPPRRLLLLFKNWSDLWVYNLLTNTPDAESARRAKSLDPDVVRTMVMHIKANEGLSWSRFNIGYPPALVVESISGDSTSSTAFYGSVSPGYLKRKAYKMIITGTQDGKPFELFAWGPDGLPFYSQKRERQIVLEQTGKVKSD